MKKMFFRANSSLPLVFLLILLQSADCTAAENVVVDNKGKAAGGEVNTAENDDVFGPEGGYIHPYLSLRGEWTDNLYNVNIDEKSNFLGILSAGVLVETARVGEKPPYFNTYNTAPAGLRLGLQERVLYNEFWAYIRGDFDFKYYSEDSRHNYTAYSFEGGISLKPASRINLTLTDRFTRNQDMYDIDSFTVEDVHIDSSGISLSSLSNIRRYSQNMARAMATWNMSEKFSARLDYTNFYLEYDNSRDDWLNRTDNRYGAWLYYNYSPKTSFFVEYRYLTADYRDVQTNDNNDNSIYGGIAWKATLKTSLMAKAGYENRRYDNDALEGRGTFTYGLTGQYRITEKTNLSLSLYKNLEATDSVAAAGKDTTALRLGYQQRIIERLFFKCDFGYNFEDYDQYRDYVDEIHVPGRDREDKKYYARPALEYLFRDWLMFELAYSYEKRDSTLDPFDYTANTIYFSLNTAW